MTAGYTIVGRIRKPHGVHGELLIETMCAEPDAIFAPGGRVLAGDEHGDLLGGAEQAMSVKRARPFKDVLLVSFGEVADRTAAESWRHRFVLVPTNELSEPTGGEVWIDELAGMSVDDVRGAHVGEVAGIEELPHGLLLEVQTPRGKASIPFVEAIVVNIDRVARRIVIDPPEGLLEL